MLSCHKYIYICVVVLHLFKERNDNREEGKGEGGMDYGERRLKIGGTWWNEKIEKKNESFVLYHQRLDVGFD